MAWTYGDYDSLESDAARLARLRLHIAEVRAVIGPDMSSAPGSVSFGSLTAYLNRLTDERTTLERRTQGATFVRTRVI